MGGAWAPPGAGGADKAKSVGGKSTQPGPGTEPGVYDAADDSTGSLHGF